MQVNPIGKGRLVVTFVSGEGLHDCKMMGKQSPMVEFTINNNKDKFKSHPAHDGGKNPKWNFASVIDLRGDEHMLNVEIWHHGLVERDFIGRVDIPLQELVKTPGATWYHLTRGDHQQAAGDVVISNTFQKDFDPANPNPQQQQPQYQQPPQQQYQQPPQQMYQQPPQQMYQQPQQQMYQPPQPQPQSGLFAALQEMKLEVQAMAQQQQQPQYQQNQQQSFMAMLKMGALHGVALQCRNGGYLHAAQHHQVNASGEEVRANTTWQVVHHGHLIALRSVHNRYLCAEDSGNVIANRENCGDWEKFHVEERGDGPIALKTHHGTYLGVHPDGRVAQRQNKGDLEMWTFQVTN